MFEQDGRELRYFADVGCRESVTPRKSQYHAPPVGIQARLRQPHLPMSQIRDDALAHAGGRVIQPWKVELFDELVERGHDLRRRKGAAELFIESYCRSIREFANLPILQVARRQIHRADRIQPIHADLRQSERARPSDLLKKLTEPCGRGRHCFRDLRPGSWRVRGGTAKEVLHSLATYRENLAPERRHLFDLFRPMDVGFKVVGIGSVGLRDYVVLFEGNGPRDAMFLQIKQEEPSAYARRMPETYRRQGQRAAEGQRTIQPISDLLLGWTSIGAHHYLVRQLNDHKGSINLQKSRGNGLASLAMVAGDLLARGHARSGDACAIRGYCGSGDKIIKALRDFACRYADQTESDYTAFLAAIESGKIKLADA